MCNPERDYDSFVPRHFPQAPAEEEDSEDEGAAAADGQPAAAGAAASQPVEAEKLGD